MKKFISAFTAAVMILGTVSLPCVAAGETDSVERVFYENFETMTSENMGGITTTDEGENVITFESVDDITYSRVIKLTTTANYKNIKANFAQALSFTPADIGANAYVEIEFDAKTNSSNLVVRPWGNSKKLQEYQIKSNKFYLNSSGTATGYSIPDTEKTTVWNRYKLVLQLTDSEGNSVQKLVGMYINGTSLGAVPEAEQGFLNSPTSFTGLVFEVKTAGEYAQVDNISVTKYNSADGTSKAPDRYALIKAVKAAKTKLAENEASLDAAKVAEISAKIDTALATYNSAGCTADNADTQKNIMSAIPSEIDAIISGGGDEENDSTPNVFYENFETMTSENMGGITTTDEGENSITFETVDDITYSRVIKLTTTANYKNIKANFAQVLSFATTDIGANAYVEIEFDAKTNSSNLVVRPWGNSKKLQEYQIKSNKFYLNSSGTATGYSIPDTEKTTVWNRYKLVLQLTDSEGNSVQKLVGMYINGTSLGAVPEAEQGFLNSPTSFTGLVFEVKTAGEYAQVDNISVTKYNSADGTSKAPDRYALIKAVKAAKTKLTENEASLDAAKVAEISAKIDTALAAYNSAGCIADTANTQKNIMNAIPEEIDAIISGGSGGDDGSGNEDGGEDDEETGGSNILFSTFENGNTDMIFIQTQPDSETENLMEITSDSENSDFLIGNYLQFSYKNNAAYPTFNATFDKISYSDESLGANCFVDTEFDLKYSNTENKNIIFRFITKEGTSKSSRIGMTLGDSSVKIKDETEEGNPEIGSCPDISDWVRFRFVMQLTDENSAPVKKITAIYADEVNVMTCDPMALKGDDYGKFAIQLPKLGDMSVCIDNFSVTKYNVSAEAEYVSRSTLGAALRSFNTKLETGKKDGKYLNEYDTLKGKINTVASALLSVGTTLEQIASYYAEIEMLEQRLSAIDLMNKTNSSACVTRLKISEASLSEKDNVSIEGTIFTNNETPLAATYAAVLFMKDEGFSGGKVCEIKSKEISLSAGNGTKESLSFDLSSYSEEEKEKMFIKAFVLKNNNIIEGGSAAFFGKNEEFYYTNAQTNDGVNASVIFTGENAQKIIIKTKAKANEKLFINVQSVQVLAESEEAVSPFVYINYVNADENGLVTVEFTPQSGVRSYNYSVIGTYTDASGSINCYSYQETQDAFNRLYAEKTAARLESEKDILQVNTTVYSLAKGSGVNITNILKGVLEEETYSPITLNKFAGSILGKLDLIYKVRNATSTDILTQALTPNLSLLENGSSYSALLSGKKQTALTKLLAKKSEVVDLNSLDTALKNAVDEANKSTTSSETSDRDYGGGGGGYAASMKLVTEVATQKETIMTAGISFDDIADVPWAYEAIAAFSGMNVINGKSETKFVPNDNITREEFVKIAVKAFALPERTDAAAFNDVEKDSWYALPISSAVNAGIVNGMEDGSFGVGRAISREDMAVIIHRLLRYVGKGITEDGIYIEFTDEYQASEYAKQAIIDLAKSGIVNGMGDNAFMPKANCTRAQATKMLYEAYRRIQ